ncbi:MAG: inositol monophosphatase [Patescibacteria group bacterium]
MIFKHVLFQAALAAGKIQLRRFGTLTRKDVRHKAYNEFVTDIDKQSERVIIRNIQKRHPQHGIISEESPVQGKMGGGYMWTIDPLDGTTNYSIGNPLFGISIGVSDAQGPLEGIVHFPFLRRTYYTRRGHGAYLNGRRVMVASNGFARSILTLSFPHRLSASHQAMEIINRLRPQVANIRVFGSASFSFCSVASGAVDAIILIGRQHPWDVYPEILFITEAGGRVSDFAGHPWTMQAEGLIASTPKIHQQLVRRLP